VVADVRLASRNMLENGLQLAALNPRSIPVVMVSGHADPELERQADQLGAPYLLKPVSPSALVDILKTRLAGQSSTTH
jgi:DNA-binding NarL/FixJ family response regulator